MEGILYGVGIGPGDPELLTLKALNTIKRSPVIAVPGKNRTETVAYKIVIQAYPELKDKAFLELEMPMTKDEIELEKSHKNAAKAIVKTLKSGKDVAFITLGDPSVYGTYLYVQKLVIEAGCKAVMVPGITSFCAASAALTTSLGKQDDMIHIVPSSYTVTYALGLKGTKVLMKAGSKMKDVKEEIRDYSKKNNVKFSINMVENCGMEKEKIYHDLEEIPDDAGYFSLIIVKDIR